MAAHTICQSLNRPRIPGRTERHHRAQECLFGDVMPRTVVQVNEFMAPRCIVPGSKAFGEEE
jgi:hypothetical protein